MTPPTAGPTINVVLNMTWLSASAAGSCCRDTRFGMAADRVGELTPDRPAWSPATTYRYQSEG